MDEKEKVLEEAFDRILRALAETDTLGGSASPSVFVVYAHDNDSVGTAYAGCVRKVIKWLKTLRAKLISDKSVLPIWSTRAEGTDAAHNILSNQFCLLPKYTSQPKNGGIGSVDKVLLVGSAVLKSYCEDKSMHQYIGEIEALWKQASAEGWNTEKLQSGIRQIVEGWCCRPYFHHVLTELALLKIRRRSETRTQNHGIIPLSIDGVDMRFITFLEGCDVSLKLKSTTSPSDLHNLLFKILLRLYPQKHSVIEAHQDCYTRVAGLVRESSSFGTNFDGLVTGEISRAQDQYIGLTSARIRDSERVPLNSKMTRQRLENLILMGKDRENSGQIVPDHCQDSLAWFLGEQDYNSWKTSKESCHYSIKGSPAQGKSVLAKFVKQELQKSFLPSQAVVLYFACFGRTAIGLDSVGAILKSLCVQLLQALLNSTTPDGRFPPIQPPLEAYLDNPKIFKKNSWRGDFEFLEHLIEDIPVTNIYIILDGLDECEKSNLDRKEFLQRLARLAKMGSGRKCIKLFTTTRPEEKDIEIALKGADYGLVLTAHQSDITLVIESMVVSSSQERTENCQRFMLDNKEHIISKLRGKAGNTYVWIRSIFWILDENPYPNLEELDELVEQVPPELEEMYRNLVARIFKDDLRTRILLLVVYAKRALSVAEVNAACCVHLGKSNVTTDDLNRRDKHLDETSILSLIGTIVQLDPWGRLVPIHQSVTDYFTTNKPFSGHGVYPDPELFCFRLCCTFLLVQRELDNDAIYQYDRSYYYRCLNNWPFYRYACEHWHHYLGCDDYTCLDSTRICLLRRVLDTNSAHVRMWYSAWMCSRTLGNVGPPYIPLHMAVEMWNKVIVSALLRGTGSHDLGFELSIAPTFMVVWTWPDLHGALLQAYKATLAPPLAKELSCVVSALLRYKDHKADEFALTGFWNDLSSLGLKNLHSDTFIALDYVHPKLRPVHFGISDAPFSSTRFFQIFDLSPRHNLRDGHLRDNHGSRRSIEVTSNLVHMAHFKQHSICSFICYLQYYGEVKVNREAILCILQHYGPPDAALVCQNRGLEVEAQLSIIIEICNPSKYNRCKYGEYSSPIVPGTMNLCPVDFVSVVVPGTYMGIHSVVGKALLTEAPHSIAQILIEIASPEMKDLLDYQTHKETIKYNLDLKLQNAFKEILEQRLRGIASRNTCGCDTRVSIRLPFGFEDLLLDMENYYHIGINSLSILMLWYWCQSCKHCPPRTSDHWLKFLRAAIHRNDRPCLKLMELDHSPGKFLVQNLSRIMLEDTNNEEAGWLLQHWSKFEPEKWELTEIMAKSKLNFKLLQEHNLRAHVSSSNRVLSRQYVSLPQTCLTEAIKRGKIESEGEHLLEYLLRQPDFCKMQISLIFIEDHIKPALKDRDPTYRVYIEGILEKHQRLRELEIAKEAEKDKEDNDNFYWHESESEEMSELEEEMEEMSGMDDKMEEIEEMSRVEEMEETTEQLERINEEGTTARPSVSPNSVDLALKRKRVE
ncbi:hypothetical protein BKA64DRAFT_678982 [Cadophora sp. MPI-SDFR-AT-0126]|nr:hypothetical protein BKA64DRAFT_678982 [Leotiomycetes sp. MPI-SDFR-AT-0126]